VACQKPQNSKGIAVMNKALTFTFTSALTLAFTFALAPRPREALQRHSECVAYFCGKSTRAGRAATQVFVRLGLVE